jgi:hypothetical protein
VSTAVFIEILVLKSWAVGLFIEQNTKHSAQTKHWQTDESSLSRWKYLRALAALAIFDMMQFLSCDNSYLCKHLQAIHSHSALIFGSKGCNHTEITAEARDMLYDLISKISRSDFKIRMNGCISCMNIWKNF